MKCPIRYRQKALAAVALAALSFFTGCEHERVHPSPKTVSLQSPMPSCSDRLVRGFYDITVSALANGTAEVNLTEYEARSFAHFRANASDMGAEPEPLVAHLKNIPREVVQIAGEDPRVLESCESFMLALHGPP